MNFNHGQVRTTTFGVVRGSLRDGAATMVPVDGGVQGVLREMVQDTMGSVGMDEPVLHLQRYEASEQHGSDDKLSIPLNSPLAAVLREFYGRENLPVSARAMEDPSGITAYFCVLRDRQGRKLVGVRRSAQFKAILEARLIRIVDDSLHTVPDDVFKLDNDFDIFMDDETVFINRTAAFEFLAEIDEQVRQAARESTVELQESLPFIGFDEIVDYIGTHKSAARLVAALRARDDLEQTSEQRLRRECNRSGIHVMQVEGKLVPEKGHELAFLQMLDRRRYGISLIDNTWEEYEAPSRKKTGSRQDTQQQPQQRRAAARAGRGGRR